MQTIERHEIPLTKIKESPTNPRRTYGDLTELAQSITEKGVLQAALVRPMPGGPSDTFELVYGSRRLRASKLAKKTTLSCDVRELSDKEVLEIQVIENGQREDVHPLEEADGYKALIEKYGYDVPGVALKIGKSVAYVYGRLRLGALGPEARDAFFADKISLTVAIHIGRIHDLPAQAAALEKLIADNFEGVGPTVDEARDLVTREFLLRLKDAPFSRTDASLVPEAGACKTCPKRTGAQPDLFGEGEKRDDLCTDAPCFQRKVDAAWERAKADAQKKGVRVLEGKEATEATSHGSKFVDLAGVAIYGQWDQKTQKTEPNTLWGEVIDEKKVEVILARDDRGVHRLVSKEAAKDALSATVKGEDKKDILFDLEPPSGKIGRGGDDYAALQRRRAAEAKVNAEVERRVFQALVEKVEAMQGFDDNFLRVLAKGAVGSVWYEVEKAVCSRRQLPLPKATGAMKTPGKKALIKEATELSGPKLVGLIFELLVLQGRQDALDAAAKYLKVDAKKIAAEVKAEVKEKQKEKKAKEKKRAAKKQEAPTPTA